MKADSHLLMAIDAVAVLIISFAFCLAGDRLVFMTLLVPAVIFLRFLFLAGLGREAIDLKAEIIFYLICTIIGIVNDLNSVIQHELYHYSLPRFSASIPTPIWMLLFWGLILRSLARFSRWQALNPPQHISNEIGIGRHVMSNGCAKVIFEIILVLLSRQAIYKTYTHPVFSWLPLTIILFIAIGTLKLSRHDWKILSIFAIFGPITEIIYIQVGHLHVYQLGWIAGAPIWIFLWWIIVMLIWKDFAFRIERFLSRKKLAHPTK